MELSLVDDIKCPFDGCCLEPNNCPNEFKQVCNHMSQEMKQYESNQNVELEEVA